MSEPTKDDVAAERPALVALAEDAYLLLDAWLHTGNLPEREYAYSVRDALAVELKKVAATKAQTAEIRLLREALERLIDKLSTSFDPGSFDDAVRGVGREQHGQ